MDKGPDAFRTISEVADDLDLPQHVLRFWETRFNQIKPLKRAGGRRYYRPDDVELLKGIRQLLYGQGYTIKGVQRILKKDGSRFVQAIGRGEQAASAPPPEERAEAETAPEGVGGSPAKSDAGESSQAPIRQETVSPPPRLLEEDLRHLSQALAELYECERILGTLADPGETFGPDALA
jgi:DNA-binding transcriptional MerR regulator